MTHILAIDPGARQTGWIIRAGQALLGHGTITNTGKLTPIDRDYLIAVSELIDQFSTLATVIAVEDVTAPKGFKHGQRAPINPESLIGVSAVLGTVLQAARHNGFEAHRVLPAGHGSGCLATYPERLVSDAERRSTNWKARQAGKGALNHERSAWDVSLRVRESAVPA